MHNDTIKLTTGACRLVAHRGLSGIEKENTCAAFLGAGLRRFWGIETDIHPTADGRFVCCHDRDLKRVAGVDFDVREHTLAEVQAVPLPDRDGSTFRTDLRVPAFEDYHKAGLRVNAWIVDRLADAARLLDMGVDLITTDILEEA